MKLRFLAVAGPARCREQLSARLTAQHGDELVEATAPQPFSLWIEPGTPVLRNEGGTAAAIGMMFDRSSARRLTELPDWPGLERIVTRDFWGPYALLNAEGTMHSVMRDPSGSVPVYYGKAGVLQVYASDAGMLRLACSNGFRPNLDTVRHWLRYPGLRIARTGAEGISELLPGMMLAVSGSEQSVRQAWYPQSFVAPDTTLISFEEAAVQLREELLGRLPLLAAGEPNVVVHLSGGLDSSIVAAAFAHGSVPFRALTFATASPEGDERRYARAVASHLGIELLEVTEQELDSPQTEATDPFHPPVDPVRRSIQRSLVRAAGTDGLLFDGAGGDNVFASINTAAPAIDAFRRHGAGHAVKALRDIAARHDCTFWSAARSAFRRARRPNMISWPSSELFLHPSFVAESLFLAEHPWLSSSDGLLPGRADHLRMIVGVQDFLSDPAPGLPCNLHPLLCQPILETCLRIPSWMWVEGGRDRAVARSAFRSLLPDQILDRRAKGSLTSMFVRHFAARRSELKNCLLSGRLAAERLIDVRSIAAYLDRKEEPRDASYTRILGFVSIEHWLQSFG